MQLVAAYLQLGEKPPYNVINIPVREVNGMPQVKIRQNWVDFPREGPRPKISTYLGHPVAGIASDWQDVTEPKV